MTVAVSVYAALVGSAALAWQVVTWRRSRRTIVGVTLSVGWHCQPTKRATVQVRVVNHSDHPITVEQVSIEGVSGSQIPSMVALGGWQGPTVPALDGLSDGALLAEAEAEIDWSQPVRARALLATGASFLSAPASAPQSEP
jgi:hypothetical protein